MTSRLKTTAPASAPLRIGILGCANIAKPFVRDVRPCAAVRIAAVASRAGRRATSVPMKAEP